MNTGVARVGHCYDGNLPVSSVMAAEEVFRIVSHLTTMMWEEDAIQAGELYAGLSPEVRDVVLRTIMPVHPAVAYALLRVQIGPTMEGVVLWHTAQEAVKRSAAAMHSSDLTAAARPTRSEHNKGVEKVAMWLKFASGAVSLVDLRSFMIVCDESSSNIPKSAQTLSRYAASTTDSDRKSALSYSGWNMLPLQGASDLHRAAVVADLLTQTDAPPRESAAALTERMAEYLSTCLQPNLRQRLRATEEAWWKTGISRNGSVPILGASGA